MNNHSQQTWYEANQLSLTAAVAEVRVLLESFAKCDDPDNQDPSPLLTRSESEPADRGFVPPALESLCTAFGLSGFERTVLLMCAGAELDSRFSSLFAAAQHDTRRTQPTFGLALAAFPDAHWSALSPARPLRRWHLLEVGSGETLTSSSLRISERVLCYLTSVEATDDRLEALLKAVPLPQQLAPSHQVIAEEIASLWSQTTAGRSLPIVNLCGEDSASMRTVAAAAANLLGLQLRRVSAWMVPRNIAEIETFSRLWEREVALTACALLLEFDQKEESLPSGELVEFMVSIRGPLFLSAASPQRSAHRATAVFQIKKPTAPEQRAIWHDALEGALPDAHEEVEGLVTQFNFDAATIRSAAAQAVTDSSSPSHNEASDSYPTVLADRLWNACRTQARPRLEGLTQRIEPAADWDDLVLPHKQKDILKQIAVHVRRRSKVYQSWGFSSKGSRGLGISAMFAGPSGTGKTMAAEVLAGDLRLDLFRIDLSQVVSKYIGETEKNLRQVFDAADEGAAILLFDEADALFGKRSEVKDSHDRYANIEVSYLLQRMEAYRGLAILTTNRKNAIDQAFLRRIRFIADFPFPDHDQRAEIWSRIFPALTPTRDLRIDRLARLNAAGGHIRNIAMGAAFLAADAEQPVLMTHLLAAARTEFAKIEKPLTDAEIAGWV